MRRKKREKGAAAMARNKHPEITVELILNTAQRLFVEIGYEKTSMQNIMDETGLSKGAIYHHFKSKEEIFNVVAERIGAENVKRFEEIRRDPARNGKEKLEALFRSSLLHPNQEKVLKMVPYLMDDPRFLAVEMKEIMEYTAPEIIRPLLEEGIADGSLQIEDPEMTAEAVMILMDLWVNPALQPSTAEETRRRCRISGRLMKEMGLDIFTEELMEASCRYAELLRTTRGKNMPEKEKGD
ncbi:MAG: TetR/AcrR family transcriptional regulator [Firmicutes bacterium]|nr:TetR/AcrR family transcriptional regulator [Bacillota bacterium]